VKEKLNWQTLGAAVVPDADVPATKVGIFINGWGSNRTTIWGNLKSSQVLISAPIPKFSGPYFETSHREHSLFGEWPMIQRLEN